MVSIVNDQTHCAYSAMNPGRCRILRLTELNKLISADVFEQNFSRACAAWADICYEHPGKWLEQIVEKNDRETGVASKKAVKNFSKSVDGYDYISLGYNGFHLLPLTAFLRAEHDVKILFIAHAPLQHVVELSLVKDLLRPGDVIICPSVNARQILCTFHAGFARYTVVIPHFIEPLPHPGPKPVSTTRARKLISLGRMTEDKLIHRQIDAMAILRQQGIDDVVMEIAGPCHDDSGRTFSYVNELKARVRRLGLEKYVSFKGTLHTPLERGAFFADASICINLSRAEEESFGKSCAEAVTMGIPVITTNWNGLPETVGRCGEIIPLFQLKGRQIVDIDPADCARAIVKLLQEPPSYLEFSRQKQLFAPDRRGADYKRRLLHPSSHIEDDPDGDAYADFFSLIPAIRTFSLSERRDMYLASLGILSENITSEKDFNTAAERWPRLADLIFHSVRARGKQLLAHQYEYTPAAPLIPDAFREIPADVLQMDEMARKLLTDCLRECDPWAREHTLTRLTALSPALGAWSLEILRKNNGSTGSLLMTEANRLLACGEAEGAARFVKEHLTGRNLLENDAPLMLYFLEICRQAGSVTMITDVLKKWLASYPDAPQCSVLWPVFATNLIIHEEHYEGGKDALFQVEGIIPDFDTSNLRSALIAMEHV